eukprot:3815689-Pyramimonas_sp.AAC.1
MVAPVLNRAVARHHARATTIGLSGHRHQFVSRSHRCSPRLHSFRLIASSTETASTRLGPRPRNNPRQQINGRRMGRCRSRHHLLRIQNPRLTYQAGSNTRARQEIVCSSAAQWGSSGDTLLQALTMEQQMALTEVVARLVPLPLPHYVSQKV